MLSCRVQRSGLCAGRQAPDQRNSPAQIAQWSVAGRALVHQRRSPSGLSLVVRWSTPAQAHQRKSPSGMPLVVRPFVRWLSSACAIFAYALVVRLTSSASSPAHSEIFGAFFKTTSLHLWPLYICHFDFRSIKWVDFQISYLEHFSSKEKYKRTHL